MRKIITLEINIDDNKTTEQTIKKFNTFLNNSETYRGYITSKEGTFKLYGGKNESNKNSKNQD